MFRAWTSLSILLFPRTCQLRVRIGVKSRCPCFCSNYPFHILLKRSISFSQMHIAPGPMTRPLALFTLPIAQLEHSLGTATHLLLAQPRIPARPKHSTSLAQPWHRSSTRPRPGLAHCLALSLLLQLLLLLLLPEMVLAVYTGFQILLYGGVVA